MKKIEKIKLLIKHPVQILINGINLYKEDYYRSKNVRSYNIEQLPTIDICDLFPDFSGRINYYSYLEGTSLITDIMLLKSLAGNFNNCAYLEIGSWRGESIANVYEVTADCTSINLSEEEMREMKISEDIIKAHGIFSKDLKNLKTIKHNSRTFDFSGLKKKFDLIFIDGDHSYEGVLIDTVNAFKLRKDKDSVIVWHDYGSTTENVRHSVLAAILNGVSREYHKNLYHVSNTLCAVYIESKEFNTCITKFPTVPNKKFTVKITTSRI